jgi:SSS family solute:Na+ symporter
LCLVIIAMPTMIGIAATEIVPGLSKVEADKVFGLVSSATLPETLAALAVAGGFAAAMTTVNSVVFGNATNVANDLYKLLRPKAQAKELIGFARACVAAIMAVCVIIAWNPKTPVAELSVIAFGTAAITIFPLWGAYYWRRATRLAAIAATLVGFIMNATFLAIGGKNMILFPQPFLLNLNGFLVSFIAAGIVFFLVSLMTQLGPVEKKSLALFFHPALEE